ncbi:hypothetical protein FHW88_003527 [Mucilaginibacter sp. SG538B]|nr:hypothetical protein [Mucilaginibacter sp. SG538B]SCW50716.1 hypothetical protein SAMN03159284_01514 [Mucilaginibacter sp. NFR10]
MSKKERKGYAIPGTDIAGLSAAAYLFFAGVPPASVSDNVSIHQLLNSLKNLIDERKI